MCDAYLLRLVLTLNPIYNIVVLTRLVFDLIDLCLIVEGTAQDGKNTTYINVTLHDLCLRKLNLAWEVLW